ncbi:MAG: hypothetical protein RR840_03820 [Clostridium sp.]
MKIPFYIIPLIVIMAILPIISIEGVTPWVLYIYFSYKIISFASFNTRNKLIIKKSINYASLNLLFIFLYNLIIFYATNYIIKNIL